MPAALGAAACIMSMGVQAPVVAADSWPAQVDATYKIHFSGLDLGEFRFTSRVQQGNYSASTDAHISAVFGAYEWKGQARSAGSTTDAGPRPASYAFNFKNQSKIGSVQMSFVGAAVTNIAAVPPIENKPGTIEVKEHHLKDVLDPLSAVLALTRVSGAHDAAAKGNAGARGFGD